MEALAKAGLLPAKPSALVDTRVPPSALRSRSNNQEQEQRHDHNRYRANNQDNIIPWAALRRREIVCRDRAFNFLEMTQHINKRCYDCEKRDHSQNANGQERVREERKAQASHIEVSRAEKPTAASRFATAT
jgi:hypothetical protein